MKSIRITPGLGNQMFQYAFIYYYKNKGEKIFLDIEPCIKNNRHNGYELERIFDIKEEKIKWCKKIFFTGLYFFYKGREINILKLINKILEIIFKKRNIVSFRRYIIETENINLLENNYNKKYLELKGDKYIDGYFQSYKYWEEYKNDINKIFIFKDFNEKDDENKNIIKKIQITHSVSIHVRRGDYIGKNSGLDVCNLEYYENAFNYILNKLNSKNIKKENINIFVFSDDIDYCKNNLFFLKDFSVNYINHNKKETSFRDMQLMSLCNYNIICNSTFSWWAAYLNKNKEKIIICPKYWFKNVFNNVDKCPKEWIRI